MWWRLCRRAQFTNRSFLNEMSTMAKRALEDDGNVAGRVLDLSAEQRRRLVAQGIKPNAVERELFDMLLDVVRVNELTTTLRVAGGWIRDKLLQQESDDIDVTLDNMTGAQFADLISSYQSKHGQKASTVAVIKKNPEQSKHLETATVKLCGLWVDFVNLRSETYETDSRIPDSVSFGTPLQDALRRDITINAMFYNVHTAAVEDLTEKGMQDLRDGVIRTPLPPMQTFLDDPLRALRVVRFAGRFGFAIDDLTLNALSEPTVLDALRTKVSRERIGIEFDKMLRGNRPMLAWDLLVHTGLYTPMLFPKADDEHRELSDQFAETVRTLTHLPHVVASSELSADHRRLVCFAATLLPLRKLTYMEKHKALPLSSRIIGESLKLPKKDVDEVALMHALIDDWDSSLQRLPELAPSQLRRVLGLVLRKAKELWLPSLSLFDLVHPGTAPARRLRESVEQLRLVGCWDMKPMLDGSAIAQLLGLPKGPQLGVALQQLIEWQLEHEGATVDDAKQWLLQNAGKSA